MTFEGVHHHSALLLGRGRSVDCPTLQPAPAKPEEPPADAARNAITCTHAPLPILPPAVTLFLQKPIPTLNQLFPPPNLLLLFPFLPDICWDLGWQDRQKEAGKNGRIPAF